MRRQKPALTNITYWHERNFVAWLSPEHTDTSDHRVVIVDQLKHNHHLQLKFTWKQCFAFNTPHASTLFGCHQTLYSEAQTQLCFPVKLRLCLAVFLFYLHWQRDGWTSHIKILHKNCVVILFVLSLFSSALNCQDLDARNDS
jgi:hypothetical protein